jgi:hypothetical protein
MEWMATITGDHVGYPRFQDFGNFSKRRKIFWEAKIHTSFGVEFRNRSFPRCFENNALLTLVKLSFKVGNKIYMVRGFKLTG